MKTDWGAIYESTYGELVRYLHRRVWDRERAQDLAQEAFARALGHAPENPRAWLYRVAGNLARDEARTVIRRKRHLALLRQETEEASAAPDPAAMAEEEERAEALRRSLERLSDRDREVLLLWNAGLSYREIAAQTGLAPGAVSTTLARALRRLNAAHTDVEGENAARG